MIILKLLLVVGIVCIALFLLSLVIYFFNLDMKLISKIAPVLNRHYDRIKKK